MSPSFLKIDECPRRFVDVLRVRAFCLSTCALFFCEAKRVAIIS
jgi:hypothetical protein